MRCKLFLFILLATAATSVVTAQLPQNLSIARLPAHPRLFFNGARLQAIKQQNDTVTKQLLFILRQQAEKNLSAPNLDYPNNENNMGTSRSVQGRIISLALAYRVFGDARYLKRAKEELLRLAAVSNWGTAHFLDVGEASLAAGIGYDWLYEELTEPERKAVADAIKTKALLTSLEVKEEPGNSSWVNGNFNWNPVCHGGLTVGALAIGETDPGLSKRIVERAIKNIPIAGDAYSPDGAFAEGPSYWSYGTTFYVLAVDALRTALGTTFNLETIPGFLKTADYYQQMQAPSGLEYNYSDYHAEKVNEPVLFWFARELNRPDLLKAERTNLARFAHLTNSRLSSSSKEEAPDLNRHTPFELLWWNPALLKRPNSRQAPLQWSASGLMPIGVLRTSWTEMDAAYLALKGGTPNNSHGHMDAGSFILEAAGVRWALDLGTENYNKMRAAKLDLWNYAQNSNRWTTFRVGPEGHNILRFNGERQLITGSGNVTALPESNGVKGFVADLSSLYANKATKVMRTALLHPDHTFSIRDEWQARDSAVAVSFQWLTKAQVTKTGSGFLLRQDGKSLLIEIETTPAAPVKVEVEDVSAARAMQDSDNPGLSRIVLTVATPAGAKGNFSLRIYPEKTKTN